MWLYLFAMLPVGPSDTSEAHTPPVYETKSSVMTIDELRAGRPNSKATHRLPFRTGEPLIRYHQFEIGARRHLDHDLLASGNDVEPELRVAAADGHAQRWLAANVQDDKLLDAMRALPNSNRKERTRETDLPLLLNNAHIGNEGGRNGKQNRDDRAVVHNEKSRLFDGRTSNGELLAIKLLLAACLGSLVGIAAAVARLAESSIGRIAAGVVALAAIAMLWALIDRI